MYWSSWVSVGRLRRALTPAGTLVLNGGAPGHVFGPVAGILRAVVVNGLDRTYPLAGTAEGLRRVEQGHARGKIVITVA